MFSECEVNVPHARKELDKSTVREGDGADHVRGGDTLGVQVDKTEDEGGGRESAQSQGSRVGELAVLNRAIQTGLELTTEGWKAVA